MDTLDTVLQQALDTHATNVSHKNYYNDLTNTYAKVFGLLDWKHQQWIERVSELRLNISKKEGR